MLVLAHPPASAAPPPSAARWNPSAPENRQVLPTFNYATVESVLAQIGARYQRQTSNGRPALSVTFSNGRRAAILFGSCEGQSCRSISIQALWNRPPGLTADRLGQAIGRFNQRYAFSRALITADGRPALQRYLTADYGFIRGNLAVNLLVFATQSERFSAEVLRP
jgi:hypothetical protein